MASEQIKMYILKPVISGTESHIVATLFKELGSVNEMARSWNVSRVNVIVWMVSRTSWTNTIDLRKRGSFGKATQYRSPEVSQVNAAFKKYIRFTHRLEPIIFQTASNLPWFQEAYGDEGIRPIAVCNVAYYALQWMLHWNSVECIVYLNSQILRIIFNLLRIHELGKFKGSRIR